MGIGALIALGGACLAAGAYFEWNWMMNQRKAVRFVRLVGRPAARIVYFVFGLGGLVTGLLVMTGLIDLR